MRTTSAPLLLLAALALAACDPELRGECSTQADCPSGTVCTEGLCLAADLAGDGGHSDGGTSSDGGSDAGTPVDPEVEIVSPGPNGAFGPGPLGVTVRAVSPSAIEAVEVRLTGTPLKVQATATGSADEFRVTLPLNDPQVASGRFALIAKMLHGDGDVLESAPVAVTVDKTGPQIVVQVSSYPVRAADHPAAGHFLRDEQVVVDAIVTDPAGLSPEAPLLYGAGLNPVFGTLEGSAWKFRFKASAPPLQSAAGEVRVKVDAKDAFGNASTGEGAVKLSRVRWAWSKPRAQPIAAAPALAGNLLYVGSLDGHVYAIRKDTGALVWDYDTGSPVVGHLAVGASTVYAATAEGRVYALDARAETLSDSDRRIFRCPELNVQLAALATGPAIGMTKRHFTDPVDEETAFVYTTTGELRMMRRTPFPTGSIIGMAFGCMRLEDVGENRGTVPTLAIEGAAPDEKLVAFVGDKDGKVSKYLVKRDQNGILSFEKKWEFGAGDRIVTPFALGVVGANPMVTFAREDGGLRALTFAKAELWTGAHRPVVDDVRASPVVADGYAFVVDQRGITQKVSLNATPQNAWQPAFDGPNRSVNATASPVVASDRRAYVANGTEIAVLNDEGAAEWRFDTKPLVGETATLLVDVATPALGCDGTLYAVASDTTQGRVYAIITDSKGLATDGWPKALHDNRNTSHLSTALPSAATCAD